MASPGRLVALTGAAILTLAACEQPSGPETGGDSGPVPEKVWLGATDRLIPVGSQESMGLAIRLNDDGVTRNYLASNWPDDAEVLWAVSDEDIIEVDALGRIEAIGAGKAMVFVSVGGVIDSAMVHTVPPTARLDGPTQVDIGLGLACALDQSGAAYCWGSDLGGAMGRGKARAWTDAMMAAPVVGGHRFREIRVGRQHACAIGAADHRAYCWGHGNNGQIGNGRDGSEFPYGLEYGDPLLMGIAEPLPVLGNLTFRALATGGEHTCGLTEAGEAFCWGSHQLGQLGTGDFVQGKAGATGSASPVPVAGGHRFESIVSGPHHVCGLDEKGRAFCWGWNQAGQLGAVSSSSCIGGACSKVPIRAADGLRFDLLAAAITRTCGSTVDGTLYCWGEGRSLPVEVPDAPPASKIVAGQMFTCILDFEGQVRCNNGGFDSGSGFQVRWPDSAHRFLSVSALSQAVCGITLDATVRCWHEGYYHGPAGVFGIGGGIPSNQPEEVIVGGG